VSAAAAADQHWRVGSTVPVVYPDGSRARLRVAAIFDHPDITGDYLFTQSGWEAHAGQALDAMILVKLKPGASAAAARAAVTAVTAAAGQPRVQDRAQYLASATSGVNTILGLVYVMLALAILIALMGVANTLSLSIHERTRELGLLRALGQTRAQARGMIRWESVIVQQCHAGGVLRAAGAAGLVPGARGADRHRGRDQAGPAGRPDERAHRDRGRLTRRFVCSSDPGG
jgi:putative ABC transport system permease protein